MDLEIIKVKQIENIQGVDARELHEWLEVGTRFDQWIQGRIAKYDLQLDEDYRVTVKKNLNPEGGRPESTEYFLSLSAARELCMVENNDKGKSTRRYFIQCEKKLKEVKENVNPLLHSAYVSGLMEGIYRNWTLPWGQASLMLQKKVKETLQNLDIDISKQIDKYEEDIKRALT